MFLNSLIIQHAHHAVTDTQAIAAQIQACHKPWNIYPLMRRFKTPRVAITNGVHCTSCGRLGMQKQKRTWQCTSCQHTDANADLHALKEYYYLIGEELTYQEGMLFLNISDYDIIRRIFKKAGLITTNRKLGRETYFSFRGSTLFDGEI